MKRDPKKLIHYIYSIVLSVSIVVAGLCLMWACLQIYLSGGEQVYTPEKVAAAFAPIAVPVYICLGLILVSFVLQLVLWQAPGKAPKTKQTAMQLQRLVTTRDPAAADEARKTAIAKLRKGRRGLYIFCAAACAVCAGVFLCFALNGASYDPDAAKATKSVIGLMYVFAPCATVAFGCSLFTVYRARWNMEKEIAALKQCPPLSQPAAVKKNGFVPVVRYVVLGLAVCLMVWGLASGGWQDVLTKAVNICTECVGLG